MNRTALVCTTIAALSLLGSAALLTAGPVNPPAGPVASSYKTLAEVEPRIAVNSANTPGDADSLYKITQPGSYYLTGSITGVAGKHGIEITSSGVTLDLNGFDLVGVAGMGAFDGVSVSVNNLTNITVANGSLRNWGDGGVDLGFLTNGARVTGVVASGNAGNGINAAISCTIANCTATFNGQAGIRTVNSSTITNCSVFNNTGAGVQIAHGCQVSGTSAYFNAGGGLVVGVGCTVTACPVYNNTGNGITMGNGGVVSDCSASTNTAIGISTGANCTISQCIANFNGTIGIRTGAACQLSDCSALSNTDDGIRTTDNGCTVSNSTARSNGGNGFSIASASVISGCSSYSNSAVGIDVGAFNSVIDCTATSNASDGIRCVSACQIRGNTCANNGTGPTEGAGIRVSSGLNNRIEGNNCTGADRGIKVSTPTNIIIGNTCTNNTANFEFVTNNYYGAIVDRVSASALGVFGSGAHASSLATTDPHANISY